MTIESLLDEIEAILEEGKSIPFSSNLLVDASAIKTAIEDIRLNMPEELMQARKIASERKEILASAQENADKIIEKAHERAKEIISEDEITRGAEAHAAEIMQSAREQATEIVEQARSSAAELTEQARTWANDMRTSASEYVESIVGLADETLTSSVNEIRRARQHLRAASQSKRIDE
jgi:F0F1-type ATP synthase membrane subunit b/b'